MRIIAGSAKGRELFSPQSEGVRPTSDRAREGLFSTLESEFSTMEDLHFLDLFAGSGAVGVEALSRGAAKVHSVEREYESADVAMKNFELVNSEPSRYQVYRQSAEDFLLQASGIKYDIIFMDPPYLLTNGEVERLLEIISTRDLLQPSGLIAVERESKGRLFTWPKAPRAMELVKQRSYGQGSIFYGGYSATVLA